eukprot:3969712-Pleurochrysis_carterae.AAC.1
MRTTLAEAGCCASELRWCAAPVLCAVHACASEPPSKQARWQDCRGSARAKERDLGSTYSSTSMRSDTKLLVNIHMGP